MAAHDHSRFDYMYLIAEKSQAFEMFKISQTEIERQLEKKIKINGVAKRRNRTLKDMVRSKISKTVLPTLFERSDQNNKL
ncbi:unnamed protein product [Prunus brigantina]